MTKKLNEGILNNGKNKIYTRDELRVLEAKLYDFLHKNDIYPEDGTFSNSENSLYDLDLELLIDGDWKHDHWFTEDLVKQFCDENNLGIIRHDVEEVGDSDSDWYTGWHYWKIDNKGEGADEVLDAIKHMMSESKSLTEAPDEDGFLTDDEIEAEERAEFEKRLAARKAERDSAKSKEQERQAKEKEESERKAAIVAKGKELAKELEGADWEKYTEVLVPASGKADTVAGEIIRAVNRIGYRYYNDGDLFNKGYGRETAGSSATYLYELEDGEDFVDTLIAMTGNESVYKDKIDELEKIALDYIKSKPELLATPNELDSRSNRAFNIDKYSDFDEPRDYEYQIDLQYYDNGQRVAKFIERGDIDNWDLQDLLRNEVESKISEVQFARPWSHYDTEVTLEDLTEDDYNSLDDTDWEDVFEYIADDLESEYGNPDEDVDESLKEDTVKQNGKWVNKGKEGTHGTFKTKKAADAQRKAIFAQGFKAESLKEAHYNPETGKVEPEWFYGVEGVEFVWHGDHNDPEV